MDREPETHPRILKYYLSKYNIRSGHHSPIILQKIFITKPNNSHFTIPIGWRSKSLGNFFPIADPRMRLDRPRKTYRVKYVRHEPVLVYGEVAHK